MTTITDKTNNQAIFSETVRELQAAIAEDPTDVMAKISLASQFEQEGFPTQAAEMYRDIIATDTDGVFAASAKQALASLDVETTNEEIEPSQTRATQISQLELAAAKTQTASSVLYTPEILALQQAIAEDPSDILAQISLASTLENQGLLQEAAEIYRQIIDSDQDNVFAASATKALADLQARLQGDPAMDPAIAPRPQKTSTRPEVPTEEVDYSTIDTTSPVLRGFQNLSIAQKQFLGILVASFISITGVVGAGISITISSGRSQLLEQASAELAVNDLNYKTKIDQMSFGFRGQSDNAAIIAAATTYKNTKKVSPELLAQVQAILNNEIKSRNIEYATLVGADRRIIANGNADRRGELFDPHGLVSQVLKTPRQIKTTDLVSWEDLNAEKPKFPIGTKKGENALIRYTVTPVKDIEDNIVGILVSGDVIFNAKLDIVAKTVSAFEGGYSAVYQINTDGTFSLASAFYRGERQAKKDTSKEANKNNPKIQKVVKTSLDAPELLTIPDLSLLGQAVQKKDTTVTDHQVVDGIPYTLAASVVLDIDGKPVAVLVRGTSEDKLNALLQNSFLLQAGVGFGGVLVAATLAWLLGRTITKPIKELKKTAEEFGEGNLKIRANVNSSDEVGLLAQTFNVMAEQITLTTEAIADQSLMKQKEAEFQREERERLQAGVIRLLLQIEEVRQGNLTVQAMVDEGEVGSIADAFNATLRSLRTLVSQVQSSANQVYDSAIANNDLITRLSDEATLQERAIQSAERSVQGIAKSIQSVAKSAQVAAKIARKSRLVAQEGERTMDETVDNIDTIRGSVADTSKKAKRLAESSQEISKIVSIIADISEKTNLLAFNASIEATRAGENGQGFRVVADEVRRLAEQVTTSAQEIEQLVGGIQDETAQMMQMMEESTTQVVTGTELVRKTKTTLQNVARISTEIDKVLASISAATVSQEDASMKVTQTMQSVAIVAQKTASESLTMSHQLQELTKVAVDLQESSAKFKID